MSKRTSSKVAICDLKKNRFTSIQALKERIIIVRGQRVMLDSDLATLYGVTTKRLNEQLRRNSKRFPADFAFRLTIAEAKQIAASRSQIATLKKGQNIKHAPHVFTEHGAIMLASVLKSKVAVQASIYVVRAFVQMRTALMEYADLARRIDDLEARYNHRFRQVFDAIRALIETPTKSQRPIGFIGTGNSRAKDEQ